MQVQKNVRFVTTIMLLGCLGMLVAVDAMAAKVLTLQQAVADPQVKVTLKSKPGGGYLGDKVTVEIRNGYAEDIQVTARVGDVLLNKDAPDQNLVVTRRLVLLVPAGQTKVAQGLYTACIDKEQSAPDEGDLFDITSNVDEWDRRSARMLSRLLQVIEERGIYATETAQRAIWKITDNRSPEAETRDLLVAAGIDPYEDFTDFPHPETPYSGSLETRSVLPSEIGIQTIGVGRVTVTLGWNSTADLDLHVTDPYGEEIYWLNPFSSSGGVLDYDDWCDDHGPDGQPGGPENIYWRDPPSGTYIVEIEYYDQCHYEGPTQWWVRILIDGQAQYFNGSISPGEIILVTEFRYPAGH